MIYSFFLSIFVPKLKLKTPNYYYAVAGLSGAGLFSSSRKKLSLTALLPVIIFTLFTLFSRIDMGHVWGSGYLIFPAFLSLAGLTLVTGLFNCVSSIENYLKPNSITLRQNQNLMLLPWKNFQRN